MCRWMEINRGITLFFELYVRHDCAVTPCLHIFYEWTKTSIRCTELNTFGTMKCLVKTSSNDECSTFYSGSSNIEVLLANLGLISSLC
jgi:hypothetical protein